ncbi:unnamed protein product [Caenorhabditis brenneri]
MQCNKCHNHHFFNHNVNFVDPGDKQVHTQSIEATWSALKRKLKRRFGDPEHKLDGHMFHYMFRRFYDNKKFLNHLTYELKFSSCKNFPVQDRVDVDIEDDDDSPDQREPNDQPDEPKPLLLDFDNKEVFSGW